MIDPVHDRRPPITPQLALRVAVLGVVAFALFAIIFFRLWYLQVLSGDQYLEQARDNRVRSVRVQAPRGAIVDRQNRTIVENRVATVVQIDPESLPAAGRDAAAAWGQQMTRRARRPRGSRGRLVPIPAATTPALAQRFERLGRVLRMSPRTIQERVVRSLALVPYSNITIRTDVPASMRAYLLERRSAFPGVEVAKVYLRRYPNHDIAAQLVGTVGEISPDELEADRFREVRQGTIVGKEGIERAYDRFLRGVDGANRITIDALGRPKGQVAGAREPTPGRQLETSLDLGLQGDGQQALSQVIGGGTGTAGAFVALDPRNGQVLAMGSSPSFDPTVLSRPITQARYDRVFGPQAGSPRYNRAIGGSYPTGSVFKPVTALAALERRLISPDDVINDAGCIKIGANEEERCNAGKKPLGAVNLRRSLQVSSDVYYYLLGRDLNPLSGQPLQRMARRLGFGRTTGIDVPGEFGGLIPDKAWRERVNRKEERYERRTGKPCCLYSDKRPWSVGDNVNLAIGQGDLQATPLQMAVAYAALANGGKVVRPHLGVEVQDANGRLVQRIDPGSGRRVRFDPGALQAVRDGLHMSTMGEGTSADVFRGWNQRALPVFGKTGTAQRNNRPNDQAWYVAWVPHRSKPIVVVATVEDGGWGAEAAAPVVCRMLSKWYDQSAPCRPGESRTR